MEGYTIAKLIAAGLMAAVPALIWGYIFYKKQVGQKRMLVETFVVGALFVTPLLFYKFLWQYFPWLDAFQYANKFENDLIGFSSFGFIPLSVIITFMIVGVIEELTKLWAVKVTDRKRIASVDDAIEMCVMAALGFAFAENILYFYNILTVRGVDEIFLPFIFRSLFSTFAHVMFSGILGYYYGLAIFSTEVLQEYKRRWQFIRLFARLLHLKKDVVFHEEKIAQGALIAIVLHAVFDIFLEMNWTFLIVPFLVGGYVYVSYLLKRKEFHKVYAHVNEERND
ncbi:PrsW family intramembrane metalloprotease [Pseudomonadota bacterium]